MTGASTLAQSVLLTALLTGCQISLHTGDPGDTGANEVGAVDYARQNATFTIAGTPRIASNNGQIQFPTFRSDGGLATYFGIWIGGAFYGGWPLTSSAALPYGIAPRFPINSFTFGVQ